MKAAVVTGPEQINIVSHTLPQPGWSQVRIRLEGFGVLACAPLSRDRQARDRQGRTLTSVEPIGLDGEGWGVIDAIGPNVRSLSVGDRVASLVCTAYASHHLADADSVISLPPRLYGMPFPGQSLSRAMNIFRRSNIKAGQRVAIIGIDFVGALLIQLASRAKAHVIAISRRPTFLAMAKNMGAAEAFTIDERGATDDPVRIIEAVHKLTGGYLCDRAIDITGETRMIALADQLTNTQGRLIMAGRQQDDPGEGVSQLWKARGATIIQTDEGNAEIGSEICVDGMLEAVAAIMDGRLDPTPLYTHRYRLEELGQALIDTHDQPDGFMKALVIY
ncbi:zinc-binding dehydrogenase [Agrobacterium vitis]|uniref:Zinc-binding dehydrogenase n=2 Tax=Agrobacterium vitis TaxID=373 RepID=A0AAE5AUR1_AGRVI|nr:zinc-binding dehydrogenase [Allorhizobium sp. Av2]MCM2439153.1 zinc-binding dehydrogenase [Agrobacterium vitis]MUZ56571.1 zinc-binding dehydrogenase [Agrobacterium vitis]MVA65277.1 zinc-binding dehydrogenase [Agrobacterium vitis]MVA86292.1 zinc-binding dehydrogenase [Agrobacterium vitis]